VNIEILILVLVVVAIFLAAALGIVFANRNKRSQKLRDKFGPEYDLTMKNVGDQRKAEETLAEREQRVTKLNIRDLKVSERDTYREEWQKIQADFVDNPSASVDEASRLITEVMIARGFPVSDFEQRAADLSVMYPNFVPNYRNAYDIALKNQRKETSTEELRQAMVNYHSMFEELLGIVKVNETEDKEMEVKIHE
jgi:type II secretory pathway pseudopilin PulG